MNKTKESIYKEISENTENFKLLGLQWFSASEISKRLNISRTIVSQYLNEMTRERIFVKTINRPVSFLDRQKLENMYPNQQIGDFLDIKSLESEVFEKKDHFKNVIGAYGSISHIVEQCKAAVSYPPNGLPVLLTGPTGSGKSYMVKILYEYLKQENFISENGKFVTLNCSEYANNPELLTANLFGYKKGAFTGAYEDSSGLIQEANGGVLFLDEVHSLPYKCQEKLFIFLDKGEFYRFGDNTKIYNASVKIIFATSENPKEVLLKTLLRRIPVIINLPSLENRPLEEKEQIIVSTIRAEENKTKRKIRVGRQVFNSLMSFRFEGNIGQLKDCIRLGCANAYMNGNQETIDIKLIDMPDYIVREASKHIETIGNEVEIIDLDKIINTEEYRYVFNLYNEILERYLEYLDNENDFETFIEYIKKYISDYYDYLMYQKHYINTRMDLFEEIVNDALKFAEERYGLNRDANKERIIVRVLYDYTQRISMFKQWEQNNQKYIKNCMQDLKLKFELEFEIADEIMKQICRRMEIQMGDLNKLFLLLHIYSIHKKLNKKNIFGVILCHGYSTASSIMDATNKILGYHIFEAIDMPLDIPTFEIGHKLSILLERESTYSDAIFLVDMGSLEEIYQYVKDRYKGNVALINGVTTKMAIEVGSNILEHKELKVIAEEASLHNVSTFKVFENIKSEEVILFINETDIHAARSMMELFRNSLPQNINIKFIPVDYYTLALEKLNASIFKDYNVVAIIGSPDPQINDIPFIPLESIIEGTAKPQINKILMKYLSIQELEEYNMSLLKNFSLQNVIEKITILNVKIVLDDVQKALEKLQKECSIVIPNKILIGLYVHLCYLIERLVKKEPIMTYENLDKFKQDKCKFISAVKKSFSDVQQRYSVEIPISEIAYIWDYINLIP